MAEDYDYIIAGAGSAGSVLAEGLSRDRGNRVLILEAGGKDDWIWYKIPVGYLFAIGNARADWCFRTQAEAGLAFLFEDVGNVDAGACFDLVITVDEGHAAHRRQPATDGGLAGSHRTNQKDVAAQGSGPGRERDKL